MHGEGWGGGGSAEWRAAKKRWMWKLVAAPDPVRSLQESSIPSSASAQSIPTKSAHTQSTPILPVSEHFGSSAHLSTNCSLGVCANAPFHRPAHHVCRSPLSEKGSYEAFMSSGTVGGRSRTRRKHEWICISDNPMPFSLALLRVNHRFLERPSRSLLSRRHSPLQARSQSYNLYRGCLERNTLMFVRYIST